MYCTARRLFAVTGCAVYCAVRTVMYTVLYSVHTVQYSTQNIQDITYVPYCAVQHSSIEYIVWRKANRVRRNVFAARATRSDPVALVPRAVRHHSNAARLPLATTLLYGDGVPRAHRRPAELQLATCPEVSGQVASRARVRGYSGPTTGGKSREAAKTACSTVCCVDWRTVGARAPLSFNWDRGSWIADRIVGLRVEVTWMVYGTYCRSQPQDGSTRDETIMEFAKNQHELH